MWGQTSKDTGVSLWAAACCYWRLFRKLPEIWLCWRILSCVHWWVPVCLCCCRPFPVVRMMRMTVTVTAMTTTWRSRLAISRRERRPTCGYCWVWGFAEGPSMLEWKGDELRAALAPGSSGQNTTVGSEADGQLCPAIACWRIHLENGNGDPWGCCWKINLLILGQNQRWEVLFNPSVKTSRSKMCVAKNLHKLWIY